jgi:hypothetical protein
LERMRAYTDGQYSLGDLLDAIDHEAFEQYVHYHDVAAQYGGKGRQYTDESRY